MASAQTRTPCLQVGHLRQALHAAAAAAVHRLDDQIAAALGDGALQRLRRWTISARTTAPARRFAEARFMASLSQASSRGLDVNAGQAKRSATRGGGHRRIGGDADDAVDLALILR